MQRSHEYGQASYPCADGCATPEASSKAPATSEAIKQDEIVLEQIYEPAYGC